MRSNLDILPEHKENGIANKQNIEMTDQEVSPVTDDVQLLASKIAVFHQIRKKSVQGMNAKMRFLGYYNLTHMQVLEPSSSEVERMLEPKCGVTDAEDVEKDDWKASDYWRRSVSKKWAVLKFARDDEITKELGLPQIQIAQRAKVKSVNELLEELRSKDRSS